MRKILLAALLFNLMLTEAFPQGEIDEEIKEIYRNERTLAFEVNSRGWGFGFRYGKHQNAFKKTIYQGSFSTLKDLRDVKLTNQTGRFSYGKLNSFYSIQTGYGIQKEHFSKFDKGGVAICTVISAGPCAGIVKPYYYIVFNAEGDKEPSRYTPNNTSIYSSAPFFYAIKESYIVPGLCFRAAASFEFSKTDKKVKAFELGANIHAYSEKIPLMATDDNRYWFVVLFFNYRFGKITGR